MPVHMYNHHMNPALSFDLRTE